MLLPFPLLFDELYASLSKYTVVVVSPPVKGQVRSSWSVYPQKRRKLHAQANSTFALIARKKIPHIFPWHENLSRVPRRIFPRGFPRPLVIRACVHVGKIRLARETRYKASFLQIGRTRPELLGLGYMMRNMEGYCGQKFPGGIDALF